MSDNFVSDPVQGYFVQPCVGERDLWVQHEIGGGCAADARCARCENSLITVLQLNVDDSRLNLKELPVSMLPLMSCPGCIHSKVEYSFTSAGEVLVDEFEEMRGNSTGEGGRIEPLPNQRILLHAIPDRIAEARSLAFEGRLAEAQGWAGKYEWDRLQLQVGGLPLLVNRTLRNPRCGLCGAVMPFLASALVDVVVPYASDEHELQLLFFLCRQCADVVMIPDLPYGDHS